MNCSCNNNNYNNSFVSKQCSCTKTNSASIIYEGPNLPYSGILTGDTLSVALQKIDEILASVPTTTTTTTSA